MSEYIQNINSNLIEFYKTVDATRSLDNSFAMPGDEPLNEEEKKAIDEFWGKYKFAYPNIDYKSFQTFKNRCGYFDVRHCPQAIRTRYFNKHFRNNLYMEAGQNKAMLEMLYPNIAQPKTVVRRMCCLLYTSDAADD